MSLFLFTNFLYLSAVIAFSNAYPFRKPFYTNLRLLLNIIIVWLFNGI